MLTCSQKYEEQLMSRLAWLDFDTIVTKLKDQSFDINLIFAIFTLFITY